ncbi:hypothetical protein AAOGI_06800 [Agarivorans albus]
MHLKRVGFNVALAHLAVAMGGAVEELREQVRNGEAECYNIDDIYMLLRVETLKNGEKELVIVAMNGKEANQLESAFHHLAKLCGAKKIRFHATGSPEKITALGRFYQRYLKDSKPTLVEAIYTVEVR